MAGVAIADETWMTISKAISHSRLTRTNAIRFIEVVSLQPIGIQLASLHESDKLTGKWRLLNVPIPSDTIKVSVKHARLAFVSEED